MSLVPQFDFCLRIVLCLRRSACPFRVVLVCTESIPEYHHKFRGMLHYQYKLYCLLQSLSQYTAV